MGFVGPAFTWSNRREGSRLVSERLDRCVAIVGWQEMFPGFSVVHLDFWNSDYRPVAIDSHGGTVKFSGSYWFHFELCWADKVDCQELVGNIWNGVGGSGSVQGILDRLEECSRVLNRWNRVNRSAMYADIKKKKKGAG